MNHRTHLAAALLTGLLAGPLSLPALAQSPSAADVISLDFKGGTAAEYLAAVRKAADDVNIVETAHLDLVPVQPVQLRRVSIAAALSLLEGEYDGATDRAIKVFVNEIHPRSPQELSVFKVDTRVHSPRTAQQASAVWSLAAVIDNGLPAEDVLSAIETGLELFGDAYPPARLRYHRETGLLLGRAHPAQIDTIHEMLAELSRNGPGSHDRSQLEQREAAAQQKIAQLDAGLRQHQAKLDETTAQLVEWRTRGEIYLRQIESMQSERDHAARDLVELRARADTMIADLRAQIAALQKTAPADR